MKNMSIALVSMLMLTSVANAATARLEADYDYCPQDWAICGGTDYYSCVESGTTSSYLSSTNDGDIAIFGAENLPGGVSTVTSVTLTFYAGYLTGPSCPDYEVFDFLVLNGVYYEYDPISFRTYCYSGTGAYAPTCSHSKTWTTNPLTSSAWTVAQVNDLQIGIESWYSDIGLCDGGVGVHQLYLDVVYN